MGSSTVQLYGWHVLWSTFLRRRWRQSMLPMCNSLSPQLRRSLDRRIRWWAASFRCPVALWKEKSFAFLAVNMLAQGDWRVCRGQFFFQNWMTGKSTGKPTGKPLVEEKLQKWETMVSWFSGTKSTKTMVSILVSGMMPKSMKPFHWTSADSYRDLNTKIISWRLHRIFEPPNLNFHRKMFPTFSTCSQRKP